MQLKIIDSGINTATHNMAIDQEILQTSQEPVLHFYGWEKPSATFGVFIDPFKFLRKEGVEEVGLDLARRPTGGGIVFHIGDLAFSFFLPSTHKSFSLNTLENYAFVNRAVSLALKEFDILNDEPSLLSEERGGDCKERRNFCMAKPTIYDVMIQGKKVGGAAQRRTKRGFLHQGTISIALPEDQFLTTVLKKDTPVFAAMKEYSFTLVKEVGSKEFKQAQRDLQKMLTGHLKAFVEKI